MPQLWGWCAHPISNASTMYGKDGVFSLYAGDLLEDTHNRGCPDQVYVLRSISSIQRKQRAVLASTAPRDDRYCISQKTNLIWTERGSPARPLSSGAVEAL